VSSTLVIFRGGGSGLHGDEEKKKKTDKLIFLLKRES